MAYVEYDEYGLSKLKCMNCGEIVGGRTYIELPDKKNIGKTVNVLAFSLHANHHEIPYDASNGACTRLILCTDCKDKDLDLDKIDKEIIKAMKAEFEYNGIPEAEADRVAEIKGNIKLIRRKKL
jgi:hypothetical protein